MPNCPVHTLSMCIIHTELLDKQPPLWMGFNEMLHINKKKEDEMKHHARQNKITNRRTNVLGSWYKRIFLKEAMD